jgi:RNA polymerase sigma factor for flagellar operon FliA
MAAAVLTPYPKTARAHTTGEREQLILRTMPLVYSIARRLINLLSSEASLDDLISAGTVGLIHAIDNYDPSFQVKLDTFAAHRIRGAMLDSVRATDWIPRRQRSHIKRLQDAVVKAQKRRQRLNVTEQEIAVELEITVEAYRELLTSVPVTRVVSLEDSVTDGENNASHTPTDGSELASSVVERAQIHEFLEAAIRRLDDDDRTVLCLYYHEERSPQEIGRIMNLPAKRVYQLKAQSILRLRTALNRRVMRKPAASDS